MCLMESYSYGGFHSAEIPFLAIGYFLCFAPGISI